MTSRRTPNFHRLGLLLGLGAFIALIPSGAMAAKKHKGKAKAATPEVQACIDAYKKAQANAQEAHLRAAKDSLAQCTKPACPAIMRQECTNRYMQLDSDIPSVIPVVTDDTGTPHSLIEVRMDGELLTSKLDGHALPVDPGKHEFSFSNDGGIFAKKNVMVVQGQRNRPISVVMHKKGAPVAVASEGAAAEPASKAAEGGGAEAPAAAGAPEAKTAGAETATENEVPQAVDADESAPRVRVPRTVVRRSSSGGSAGPGVLTYVAAGVGVAGVTGYFLLNYWGKKDNDALNGCASEGNLCSPASVDHVHKLYVGANISGAVGLVALASAGYLYYRSQTAGEEVTATRTGTVKAKSPTASIRVFDVQAMPSGALATVGGSF